MADEIIPLEIEPPVPPAPKRLSSLSQPKPRAAAPVAAPAKPAAPAEPPPTWSQIEGSPKYQALDNAGRESVRMSFWRDVVSPLVPTAELKAAREEFDKRTKPSLLKRAAVATQQALGGREAPRDLPSLEGEAAAEPPQVEPPAPPPAAMPARLRAQQEMGQVEADWFGDQGVLSNAPAGMVAAGKNAVANMGAMSMEEAARQTEVEQLTGLSPAQRAATYSPRQEALRHRDPLSTEGMPGLPAPGAERDARLRAMKEQARAAGEDYKKWAEQTRKELELIQPAGQMSDLQQGVWSFVQSAPPTLMGIAVGIATRNPAAAMAIAGGGGTAFQAGATYGEATEKGVDHDIARRAALIDGILEGVGEAIPLRVALRAGSPFVRRLTQTIGEEAGQEGITQFLQDLNAFTSYNPDITLQEAWQNFKVALIAGAVAGSVYGTAGGIADQARFVSESKQPPATPLGAPGQPPPGSAAPPRSQAAAPEDPAEISRMIAGEDPLPPEVVSEVSPAAAAAIPAEQALGREEAEEAPEAPPAAPAAPGPETTAPAPSAAPAPAGAQEQQEEPTPPPVKRPAAPAATGESAKPAEGVGPTTAKAPPRGEPPPPPGSRVAGAEATPLQEAPATEEGQKKLQRAVEGLKGIFESPVDEGAHQAASSPTNDRPLPTPAQIEANNAKLGHTRLATMPVSIENPAGSLRKDIKHTPPQWRVKMQDHYGYLPGTIGFDKDHLDVFIQPGTREDWPGEVYVVNQTRDDGKFDEHKAILGVTSPAEARELYLRNYSDRAKAKNRIKSIVQMRLPEFKDWAYDKGPRGPRAGELKEQGVERALELPMLGKKPETYRGVPSAKIEVIEQGGRFYYDLGLQTNVSGIGTRGARAYESPEAALEGAIEAGLKWVDKDVNMAADTSTEAHRKHIERLRKWLEEQRPKGGPDAGGDKSPQVRGKAQAQEGEPGVRDLPGRDETELRDREAAEKGARGPGAGEEAAPAERGGEQVIPQPFASGMSRDRDMRAAIASAAGVGVEIGEVSGPGIQQLANAVAAGKEVFVDSGAFNNYKARKRAEKEGKKPPPEINFDRVLERYRALSDAVHRRLDELKKGKDAGEVGLEDLKAGLLMFVAPDKVGEQEATLELLEKYGDRLRYLADEGGHEIIIPFQRGSVKQSDAYKRVAKIMGGDHFVVGIPSAVEALDDAQMRDLLDPYGNGYHPERIHILGAVAPSKMESRMKVIREIYEDEVPGVTADAMVLRSKLSEVRGLEGEEKFDRIVEILSGSKAAIAAAHEARTTPFELAQEGALSQQQVATLTEELRKKLLTMHGFKTIMEVRAWARDKIGTPIKPGTMAAKQLDEAIEVAIVDAGRTLVKSGREKGRSVKEIFGALVSFYDRQPTLGVRTSTSIRDQAYSTPLPLAFLASRMARISGDKTVLEPTAGNGMLLIEANPEKTIANELNEERAKALSAQGFTVTSRDASEPGLRHIGYPVDVVIANPPFGYVKDDKGQTREWKLNPEYKTNQIDHAIAMRALQAMKDDGRAVLIVAAPDKLKAGESRQDAYNGKNLRAFYYTLYRDYNVVDQFTVAGDLYAKQGAAWPVDVIVIDGRATEQNRTARGLPAAILPRIYESWGELEEKFDERYTARVAEDRRPGEATSRGELGPGARDEAGGVSAVGAAVGPAAGEPGQGGPGPVRGGPPAEQPGGAGPAAPEGPVGRQRGERGEPRGAGEPADVGPLAPAPAEDVGKIFDEEFSKAFGDLEKAPPRSAGEAAASAAKETGAGIEEIAKGLDELFGTRKGRLGSGLQFDEETYAKAKPHFIAALKHFQQAGQDVREAVRALIQYLREIAGMTAEAINRMRPYVVRFVEDVQAGKIPELVRAPRRPVEAETEHQVAYTPASGVDAIGTLVPVNMRDSTIQSLKRLQERVGDLDEYVASELGYAKSKLGRYFGAEQVDALALALTAIKDGKGFIIGDQTGVGKGRVVAGIIRYAMRNGKTALFTTEKPNLYKDIYRDLVDIGMPDVAPIMTNAGQSIPLTDDGDVVLKSKQGKEHNALLQELVNKGNLGENDMVFTTYSQMQTVKGGQRTARMAFLEAFARGGVLILDESHNAGGTATKDDEGGKKDPTRADFVRSIARMADAVFYSSATYAKRPEVMDLYFKTDMSLAVDNAAALPAAIRAGGVPLQQVVASMLVRAGQYIRRERSFAGVTYNTTVSPVNREIAERMSSVMRRIAEFDILKKAAIKALKAEVRAEAKTMTEDGSVGLAGVTSTTFTSLMHNMVDQMLLALKVIPAAEMAVNIAKTVPEGQKPVLTVSNTMGSFIQHYIEDHGLNPGDAIDISFGDLLMRYLERSRDVVIGNAFGKKTRHRLTDDELGLFAVQAWNSIKEDIERTDFSAIPLSPIDYIKSRILKEGLSFGEITGRVHLIDYTGDVPTYRLRPGKEISVRGRNETITAFNSGKIDVLLINQAGATGLSLHSSDKFKDKRKRHMMIVQPERNIDTHMQMLGRVHRTGQVVPPEYTQLVADIPAEKRPAAVLAKKMASLNANTTAARGSALTSREVVDFMNQYGDEVVAQLMEDNPQLHRKMGSPLDPDEEGAGLDREDAMRQVTGRIPLLTLREQEDLYDLIESEYLALIDEKDRMGENALEAKTLPLEAKVKKVVPVSEGKGGDSPFAAGAQAEIVDVKRLGKPYTSTELIERVRLNLEAPEGTSLTDLRTRGNEKVNRMREQLETEFRDYEQQELDSLVDQRHRDSTKTRLDAQHERLQAILGQSHIGRPVELRTRFGTIPAMVVNVEVKGRPKNPAAMGAWKITYAVADAIRHVTLPASRLTTPKIAHAGAVDAGLVMIEDYRPSEHDNKKVQDLFDEAQSVSREDRVIMTGNLLAAYGKFPNGRIINYTTEDGRVQQGILMPAKWDVDKAINEMPVEFPNARTAIEFLEHMNGQPVIESVDERVFRVAKLQGEDSYRISVAAARDKGGIIYLHPKVLEAAGQDFVKGGNSMRVELPKERAIATLQAMIDNAQQRVHTNAYRQEAKEFLARQAPPVVRMAARQGLPESKWLPEAEIRRRVDEAIKGIPHPPYIGIVDRPSDVFEDNRIHDWVMGFTVNQKVYLARSGIENLDEVETVVWHELFHYGVRRFMTREQYIATMNRLYTSNTWISSRANDWLGTAEGKIVRAEHGGAYARARAVDEAMANLAERLQGMTEEEAFAKASPLDNAIMAIVRWAADVAERFGAMRMAARIRGYTNEDAIRFVTRIFSRLKMNEASVSGPGTYEDVSFMQESPQARQRRREERARRLAKDTGLGDKILAAPFKLAKWDAMAVAAWEKVREMNERATEAYPAWETVRAGVESDYGLEEQYLDHRVEMQVHLQKWARGAKNLLDQIAGLTRDESRVAYEWMHERDADHLIEELPEESKATLRSIKELIRSLGQEAVRLGQLSQEVFERNELAYLHRSYLKHEIESTIMSRLGNRKAIAVWAEQYKGRGIKDWRTQEVLNSMAREPLDPREMKGKKFYRLELRARVPDNAVTHLEQMSGHRPLGKLRKAVYWPEDKPIPAEYAGWHNDGLWEVRWRMGGKWGLWRDLSKPEREALGEIDEVRFGVAKTLHLMTHDIEIGRMQEWVAQNYAKAELEPYEKPYERSASESLASTFGKLTWVKVPSTEVRGTNVKKYGALAGKYVPGPIWNDVRQHVSLDSGRGALRKAWDDLLRLWKISKTALSPGVHMNNIMANVFIADFHDLRAKDLLKAIRVLTDARLSKKPDHDNLALYQRFEDSGALHGMFKYHELKAEVLDPLLEDIRRQSLNDEAGAMVRTLSVISWLNGLEKGGRRVANAMIETYGAEDEVFRLAAFIKALRNGFTDVEAGRLSRKAFLDYDINAPWIQALRRTAFPFIAFPYRAIPMMIDTFTHKPWKLIKYVAVAALLDELAYAWLGLDDEDEERERRLLADEKSGRIWGIFPKMIRMPWNREGNPVFLDVRRWFPSGDIFDTAYSHAAIPWSPALMPGGPLALIAEVMTNRASFTGQEITLETDKGWEKAEKLGMHLYRFAMPNLFMIPGTWSFEGIRGALGLKEAGPQTDVFGREFSVPQALGNAIGVKLGTYPEDVLRYNLIRKTDAHTREIMGNIYKAVGDRARNKMSDAELREYVQGQLEKVKKLQEETAKKVRPPAP